MIIDSGLHLLLEPTRTAFTMVLRAGEDKNTIYGATFDHKAETPGLGAEISKDFFMVQFKGKKILDNGKIKFAIVKGGAKEGDMYGVDAISGGTITSKGLEDMLIDCLNPYGYFLKN